MMSGPADVMDYCSHGLSVLAGLAALPVFLCPSVTAASPADSLLWDRGAMCVREMAFDSVSVNTGTVDEDGQPVEVLFRWTNMSDRAVCIDTVLTSCGCVVPAYPAGAVPPGGTAGISAVYYQKGHPGGFVRKMAVFTSLDTENPSALLEMDGYVEPAKLPVWNFPVEMGDLRLKYSTVKIAGDVLQAERISCLNTGNIPLSPVPAGIPPYIKVWSEPREISPGAEGHIIIKFDPRQVQGDLPERLSVHLDGLSAPAGDCTVDIVFRM